MLFKSSILQVPHDCVETEALVQRSLLTSASCHVLQAPTRSSAVAEGPRDAPCQVQTCQLGRLHNFTKIALKMVCSSWTMQHIGCLRIPIVAVQLDIRSGSKK